ncbi:siderophore-interacting protein [Streptomyces sp. LP05-1]|uniref:Siderophore-interacting protein n=1 Tax=Streptomyces pyxinae TaxID=2970734 RepID=A0ABT2CLI1_9ACTN|nr:siderophore-interacting protein [Streptomyces sp. LP05-1]MCS0638279.1 siderophore-interacting protein [Streptomyces sp. LP05-1]
MARTNAASARVKPEQAGLIRLNVLRQERVSPGFARVTLGGGDIEKFTPMGFDQWFRLFIPVAEDSLSRLPNKLDALAYAKYLTISKASRPVLRNYTVRAYRPEGPEGPELDVDFVLHGSAADGTAGPASAWAESCSPGDQVAILDEGITFTRPEHLHQVLIVSDETGLPAVAGILASLDSDITGQVLIEVPAEADRQELEGPKGVEVNWVVRGDAAVVPGHKAREAVEALPVPREPFYAWVVGESTLPTALRRHWVRAGVPKENIKFCGYWKAGRTH